MKKILGIVLGIVVVLGTGFVIIKDEPNVVKTESETTSYGIQNVQNLTQDIIVATRNNDKQVIETVLSYYGYPILVVEKNVPVEWIVNVEEENLTSCNNLFYIPDFQIQHEFSIGENKIEFIPNEVGIIDYQCWMGMIRSNIVVVDDLNEIDLEEIQQKLSNQARTNRGRCCGD
jgi:uncharacterized protein